MIEKLDDSVGRICQVIKTLGIADRTIVIFIQIMEVRNQ